MSIDIFKGKNNSTLVVNYKGLSVQALEQAFNLLMIQKQHSQKAVLLCSDTKVPDEIFYFIKNAGVTKVFLIGENIQQFPVPEVAKVFDIKSVEHLFEMVEQGLFKEEAVLLASNDESFFKPVLNILSHSTHKTSLEVSLDTLRDNFQYFKSKVNPNVKILAMVKAYSYGSASYQVGNYLQSIGVDYLGVAYIDEGIQMRKAGNTLPILVLNSDIEQLELLLRYKLEPEIYSFSILKKYIEVVQHEKLKAMPVHIKLETGMNRLGFQEQQLDDLINLLLEHPEVEIKGIMSHFSIAGKPEEDDYTERQIAKFESMSNHLIQSLNLNGVIRHICNSAGAERFPKANYNMVRLGIGLYGHSFVGAKEVSQISRLKAHISQIKPVSQDSLIGYELNGKLTRDSRIGVVSIGYADGFNRLLSKGNGQLVVHGKRVSVVGNVCMDMCMVDLTDVPEAKEGDEVIVFGPEYPATILAEQLNTNIYEVLACVGKRVRYVYTQK